MGRRWDRGKLEERILHVESFFDLYLSGLIISILGEDNGLRSRAQRRGKEKMTCLRRLGAGIVRVDLSGSLRNSVACVDINLLRVRSKVAASLRKLVSWMEGHFSSCSSCGKSRIGCASCVQF